MANVKTLPFRKEAAAKARDGLAAAGSDYLTVADNQPLTVRVLPRVADDTVDQTSKDPYTAGATPFKVVFSSFINNVDPNGEPKAASVIKQPAGVRDPVATLISKLAASDSIADKKAAQKMGARAQAYVNVINRATPEAGPKILRLPKTAYDTMLEIADTGGDYTDVDNGYDLTITRRTVNGKTQYSVVASRSNTRLGDDAEIEAWLSTQHDLNRFAPQAPEEVEATLTNLGYGDFVGGGEVEAPRPRTASKATRFASDSVTETAEEDFV